MALTTVHPVFDDRMTMRQIEFGMRFEMALKTGGGVLAWVDDEHAVSAFRRNVFAAGAVTGFTTRPARELHRLQMNTGMSAAGESPGNVRVTLSAGLVADKSRPRNLRWRHDHAFNRRTGTEQNTDKADAAH